VIARLSQKYFPRHNFFEAKSIAQHIDMPGVVKGAEGAGKRKRSELKHKPIKRARSESSEEDVQARILLLENQIFESKKNYNNISTLIKLVRAEGEESDVSIVASIALCRIFTRLLATGELAKPQAGTEKDSVVSLWLRERYSEYKTALVRLLGQKDSGSTVLTLCMRMLKSEGSHLKNGQDYSFPVLFLNEILKKLVAPNTTESVRDEFSQKYLEEYDDIRFYTFGAIE
jgi:U3 small nucleolar RNA-associated protein 19